MVDFLTPDELVERWRGTICKQTLANWRNKRLGPGYVKVGRSVLYPMRDVERWEAKRGIRTTGKGER